MKGIDYNIEKDLRLRCVDNTDSEETIKVSLGPTKQCPAKYESFSTRKNTYYLEKVIQQSNVSKIYLVHTHNTINEEDKNCNNCERYIIKKYYKESVKQAKNEYKILKKLDSEYIIRIIDKDVKNGLLVMNKYSQDMFDLLVSCQTRAKKLSKRSIKKYFTELVDAIFYLHSHNIAHLDIKPENILLTDDHHVLFIDFGFAKVIKKKIYKAKGTPFYAAPELCYNEDGFDAFKTDIWALGMTFYLLLERRRPFNLDQLQNESHISISKVWKLIDKEELDFFTKNEIYNDYRYLISKMLEKDPEKRWNIYQIKAENDNLNNKT